jgi:hypothetical protein
MIKDFGIDKLTLTNGDFQVNNTFELTILPNAKKAQQKEIAQSYLFSVPDEYGELVPHYGKGAHINTELFNVDFYTSGLMLIRLNPSKIYGSLTTDPNVIYDTVKRSCIELGKLGVYVNPESFKVNRIDATKDGSMEYVHPEYAPIFNRRTMMTRSMEYPDGIRFGSSESKASTVIYDKGKLYLRDKYGTRIKHPSTNHMRTEASLNRKGITDFLPTQSLAEFLTFDQKQIADMYLKIVKGKIDVLQMTADFVDVTSVMDLMQFYKGTNTRYWFYEFMIAISLRNENIPNSVVYQAIDLCDFPKSTKADMRKKYKESTQKALFAQHRLNELSQDFKTCKQLEYNEKFIFSMAM